MTSVTHVLAGAALAATVGAAASAQDFAAGSFYAKGFGGFTWPSNEDSNVRSGGTNTGIRLDLNYDTGYTLGASLGYLFTPNVALELEYAYRRADFTATATLAGVRERDDGHTTSNSVMVNALYVFDGMGPTAQWQPYLGGGIGGAELDVDGSTTDTLFAYQLIGGVGYEITPNWTVMGEVRWFQTQDGKVKDDGLAFDTSFDTFDLLFGASYSF